MNGTGETVDAIIDSAIDKVFNFDFPLFDENYKGVLCKKILKHYYTREIGLETVGLWKLKLNTKLNEIMPYYNKLYSSELLLFNPLHDVDVTTTHKNTLEGGNDLTNNVTNNNNKTNLEKHLDTPQGGIGSLVDGSYLTYANQLEDTATNITNATSHTTLTNIEDYLENISGKRGGENISDMLQKYRATFLNIDMLVVNDLSDLFMNIW